MKACTNIWMLLLPIEQNMVFESLRALAISR